MMKLEMTAELSGIDVTLTQDFVQFSVCGDYVSLTHDDIKTLTTLLERYKSALKEAHGG